MKVKGVNAGKLERVTGGRVGAAQGGARAAATSATRGTRAPRDDVALSSAGRIVGAASEALHSAPDVRQERIQPIREALAAGTYDVASIKVADRILRQVLAERKRPR